jgi:TIR domain-containing protein
MLPAKDVVPIEDAFISALEHIPGTKIQKQEYFKSRGIRVPHTNYGAMWDALTSRLHRSGAASAVFDCLRANMPNRLTELIRAARRRKTVSLRANEPAIVWDFFFQNGNLRRIGQLFLESLDESGYVLRQKAKVVPPVAQAAKPYEVAFSFAGEDRGYVDEVARELDSMGVRVFYDRFEQVNLLGKDLAAHFAAVYGKHANYCAMFISKDYVRKAWPRLERQHAQSRALVEKREYILPIRLDDTDVPGLPATVGYLDARGMRAKAVADILFHKIRGT